MRSCGVNLFEESVRDLVDGKAMSCFPLSNCIIEEFCGGEGTEVPRVATVIRVFWIATDSNSLSGVAVVNGTIGIYGIDRAERVDKNFEVCKRLAGTWLEGWAVTVGVYVEDGDWAKNCIRILSGPSVLSVDIGRVIFSVPE